jgi:hypothetical protein
MALIVNICTILTVAFIIYVSGLPEFDDGNYSRGDELLGLALVGIVFLAGPVLAWAVAQLALLTWLGSTGFLVILGGTLLISAVLAVVRVKRTPNNPVRDAIAESRLTLGQESSVLS